MRFLKRFIGQHCTVVGQNGLLVYCTHKHHENDEGARANKTCIECASRKFYCPLLIFFFNGDSTNALCSRCLCEFPLSFVPKNQGNRLHDWGVIIDINPNMGLDCKVDSFLDDIWPWLPISKCTSSCMNFPAASDERGRKPVPLFLLLLLGLKMCFGW